MEQVIYYESYTNLSHIELWENQRDPNMNLVDSIVKSQLEYYKKYKEFTFPGVLVAVNFDNNYYLIDGQHRFESLKNLYNNHAHDVKVAIQTYKCNNKNQINELYGMLNNINPNNCMVTDGKLDPDGLKLKQIKTLLKEKYGYKIWVDKDTNRPYVSTIKLDSELRNAAFFNNKTSNQIITAIEEKNKVCLLALENISKTDYHKVIDMGGFALPYDKKNGPSAKWIRTLF